MSTCVQYNMTVGAKPIRLAANGDPLTFADQPVEASEPKRRKVDFSDVSELVLRHAELRQIKAGGGGDIMAFVRQVLADPKHAELAKLYNAGPVR